MAKIVFTRHALTKLRERNIQKEQVLLTIRLPQRFTTEADKFHAFRKFGKFYLKVIFTRLDDTIIIVTQYFTNRPL